MEPATYFTIFVIGICALHLACQAADRIGTWMGKTQQHMTYGKTTKQSRDDWYVFFHRSDLTGQVENLDKNQSKIDRPTVSRSKRARKSSRRLAVRVNMS